MKDASALVQQWETRVGGRTLLGEPAGEWLAECEDEPEGFLAVAS